MARLHVADHSLIAFPHKLRRSIKAQHVPLPTILPLALTTITTITMSTMVRTKITNCVSIYGTRDHLKPSESTQRRRAMEANEEDAMMEDVDKEEVVEVEPA